MQDMQRVINISVMIRILFVCLFACVGLFSFAQTGDKKHYPDAEDWTYLHLKNSDTVLTCMRYYFLSDDTIYFRELPSLQVIKMATADFQSFDFALGKDYQFAEKGMKLSTRLFYSKKLDRFYDYYLHAPAVHFEPKLVEKPELTNISMSWNQPSSAQEQNPLAPKVIYTKDGCRYGIKRLCFFSNNMIYFTLYNQEGIFYAPLSDIVKAEGIYDLGRDLDLGHRYEYRRNTRRMVIWSIIIYPSFPIITPFSIFRMVRHHRYRKAKMISCIN